MSARRTKFYLDKRNRKWSGVCSGLADYTGIDVTLVRVGVVLLTLIGGFPWTLIAYWMVAWLADDRPSEFNSMTREDEKFWQTVRARPGASVRDVRSKFRDIDRRIADIETHVTTQNSALAREIDALR
ncbi:envelope stress response membrane protein PspC [Sphingomonas montanisoli]|uniref:Envelope stress response membrane protein PspC n=1 Tax=Sphingomonas montanisoli TaxID=2606412 RepID=A0A5D9C7S7_9SPHN|nr:envelope stress response membrane protein PspC [Sphingomonas montanisoli]TZG27463.1 envelope stress response membrane protein PspC [Sphingomonas montanisoli]